MFRFFPTCAAICLAFCASITAGGCHSIAPYATATGDAADVGTSDGPASDGPASDGRATDGGTTVEAGSQTAIPATSPQVRGGLALDAVKGPGNAYDVAMDALGNSWVVGSATGSYRLANGAINLSTNGTDGLVIALDTAGTPRWALMLASGVAEHIEHVAVSRNGRYVAVASQYTEGSMLGNYSLPKPADGSVAAFVALLDAQNGEVLWADRCEGARDSDKYDVDRPIALDVDDAGRLAWVVSADGPSFVCGDDVTHALGTTERSSVLVRYECALDAGASCTTVGAPVVVASLDTVSSAPPVAIALGQQNRLHMATRRQLVARSWETSEEIYQRPLVSDDTVSLRRVALRARASQLALVASYAEDVTPDLGTGPLVDSQLAVALYEEADNAVIFVHSLGKAEGSYASYLDVDLDGKGALVLAGRYDPQLGIGSVPTPVNMNVGFLAAFDGMGDEPRWARLIQDEAGMSGEIQLHAMAFGGGRFITGGSLKGSATFAETLFDAGDSTAFFALTFASP